MGARAQGSASQLLQSRLPPARLSSRSDTSATMECNVGPAQSRQPGVAPIGFARAHSGKAAESGSLV